MKHLLILASAFAIAGPVLAGVAEVKFVDPSRFTDLATSPAGERETMDALAGHMQKLSAALPADQVLHVEVLDVDLAGDSRPSRRGNIRVNNGLADAPRIHLRYTLETRGQVLRTGEERLTDSAYQRPSASWRATGQYHYEKQLLSDWFTRTFTEARASR